MALVLPKLQCLTRLSGAQQPKVAEFVVTGSAGISAQSVISASVPFEDQYGKIAQAVEGNKQAVLQRQSSAYQT